MSLEAVGTAASLVTAFVVAATAIAALVQLHHIRQSNELSAFNQALELWYLSPMQEGLRFIQRDFERKMQDPQFRRELDSATASDHSSHPELYVLDFFDNIGVMISLGMLREAIILHPAAQLIDQLWEITSPAVAIMRRKRGLQMYVSFEYLAHRAKLWQKKYPEGYQVPGWTRLSNPDVWRAADDMAESTSAAIPATTPRSSS